MVTTSHQNQSQKINPRRSYLSASISDEEKEQAEDAVFESVGASSVKKEASSPPQKKKPYSASIFYNLMLRAKGDSIEVSAERDDERARPWGFWTGSAMLAALVSFVFMQGAGGGIFAIRDVFIVMLLACLAIVAFRFGPRGERSRIPLTYLNMGRKLLIWPPRHQQHAEIVLPFEQISEVVFGMIYFPLSPGRPDSRVQVYTVLVRDARSDELLPIIEASAEKRSSFVIAEQIAHAVGVPMTQIGEGVWTHPHP